MALQQLNVKSYILPTSGLTRQVNIEAIVPSLQFVYLQAVFRTDEGNRFSEGSKLTRYFQINHKKLYNKHYHTRNFKRRQLPAISHQLILTTLQFTFDSK